MPEESLFNKLREKYAAKVDWFVYTELARGSPREIYDAATYLYRSGGKRVRPFITMAVARMLGGIDSESRALPLAAAVEVFHNFTLIHDDIMDQDEFRRGVPTTHIIYGVPYAILAGDLAHALSYKAIGMASRYGLNNEAINTAYDVLIEAAIRVSEGQAYDMMFENMIEVNYHDYLRMIYLKTGALLEAASKLGVVAASNALSVQEFDVYLEELGNYGKFVGLAFQIRDDILGVYGDPKITGKPRFNDLIRGKKTLLVLYAYNHAKGKEKELLRKVLERKVGKETEVLEEIADIIKSTGALDYAEKLAKQFSRNAVTIIDEISSKESEEAAEALKELAIFVVERNK